MIATHGGHDQRALRPKGPSLAAEMDLAGPSCSKLDLAFPHRRNTRSSRGSLTFIVRVGREDHFEDHSADLLKDCQRKS